MARLPIPGEDDGSWGDILNEFLRIEHNEDGTQKTLSVSKGGTGATNAAAARVNLGVTAANIPFTPAGTLSSTNVQSAIEEAASEAAAAGNYFTLGGNAFGADAILGTTDTQPLIFTVAGSEKARIETNGNVGIGVTVPTQKLDVNGSINIANNGEIQNGGRSWIQQGTSGTTRIYADTTGDTQFYFGGTRKIWFANNGNVGLGAAPVVDFEVTRAVDGKSQIKLNNTSNTVNAYSELLAQSGLVATYLGSAAPAYSSFGGNRGYLLQNNGTGLDVAASAASSDIRFYTGGYAANKERVRIDASGNMGIGITSPLYALHVKSPTGVASRIMIDTTDVDNGTADAGLILAENGTEKWRIRMQGDNSDRLVIRPNDNAITALSIAQTGKITLNGNPGSATLTINGLDAATAIQIVKGAASQVANLQEWQDSTGAVLSRITSTGGFSTTGARISQGATGGFTNTGTSIETLASSWVGLAVRGLASQSANLQEWQNSSATVLASLSANGTLAAAAGRITNTVGTGNIVLIVQGIASQGSDLQQWQNSSNTPIARLANDGSFIGPGSTFNVTGGNFPRLSVDNPLGSSSAAIITTGVAGAVGLIVKGSASQTADLLQFQNSSGINVANITAAGSHALIGAPATSGTIETHSPNISFYSSRWNGSASVGENIVIQDIRIGGAAAANAHSLWFTHSDTNVALTVGSAGRVSVGNSARFNSVNLASQLTVGVDSASTIGLTVRGAASQSANLQEWQNSSGSVLASINSAGTATFNNINMSQTTITASSDPVLFVSQTNASNRALVVRGAASQTGDLQQWQDSSGNSLAVVGSDGTMSLGGVADVARYFYLRRNNAIVGGMGSSNAQMTIFAGASAVDTHLSIDSSGKVGLGIAAPASKLDVVNPLALAGSTVVRAKGAPTAAATITNKALTSNVATLTTSGAHGFSTGKRVAVAGVDATFNGTYTIASTPTSTTFTYSKTAADVASTSASGTATSSAQTANLQEWQDGTSTIFASIDSNGGFTVGSAANGVTTAPGLTIAHGYAVGEAISSNLRPLRWSTHSFPDAIEFLPTESYNTGASLRIHTKRGTGGAAARYSYFYQGDDPDNSYPTVFSGMSINTTSTASAGTGTGGVFSVFSTKLQNDGTTAVIAPGPTIWTDGTIKQAIAKPANTGHVIKAAASQTANLQEWQKSDGTIFSKVLADGTISITPENTGSNRPAISVNVNNTTTGMLFSGSSGITNVLRANDGTLDYWKITGQGAHTIQTLSFAAVPLTIKGAQSTVATITNKALTSNVATLTASAAHGFTTGKAVTITGVDSTFNGTYLIASTPTSTTFTYTRVQSDVASTAASGSAVSDTHLSQLLMWQNGAGANMGGVLANGTMELYDTIRNFSHGTIGNSLTSTGGTGTTFYSGYNTVFSTSSHGVAIASGHGAISPLTVTPGQYTGAILASMGPLTVGTSAAGNIAAIIKAASSQTANLQEWQHSSTGALASINNTGALALTGANFEAIPSLTRLYAKPQADTERGIIVRAFSATSSAALIDWQDSTGISLGNISPAGKLKLTPSSDATTNFQVIRFATGNNDFSVGNQQINLGNSKTLISWATAAALAIQPSTSIAVGTIVAAHPTDQSDVTKTIFRVTDNSYSTPWLNVVGGGSVGIGTSDQFGSGVGVVGIKDAGTVPSTNPTGGGVLYSEGGILKWRRSDGTVDAMGSTVSGDSDQIVLATQIFS